MRSGFHERFRMPQVQEQTAQGRDGAAARKILPFHRQGATIQGIYLPEMWFFTVLFRTAISMN